MVALRFALIAAIKQPFPGSERAQEAMATSLRLLQSSRARRAAACAEAAFLCAGCSLYCQHRPPSLSPAPVTPVAPSPVLPFVVVAAAVPSLQVAVPPGVVAGQQLAVTLTSGLLHLVVVPHDVVSPTAALRPAQT